LKTLDSRPGLAEVQTLRKKQHGAAALPASRTQPALKWRRKCLKKLDLRPETAGAIGRAVDASRDLAGRDGPLGHWRANGDANH
jgi:hypothetical protein